MPVRPRVRIPDSRFRIRNQNRDPNRHPVSGIRDPESGIRHPASEIARGSERAVLVRAARPWGRRILIAAVLGWFALLILAPTAALVQRALSRGPGGRSSALWPRPKPGRRSVSRASRRSARRWSTRSSAWPSPSCWCGSGSGARRFIDGLVDLPFAVSPIIAGLMLIVLYGPQGWIGRWLEAQRRAGGLRLAGDGAGDACS